ncbi:hypothetical protein THZB04_170023 [Vibrio owensii]|nr:hypothetical protein THZB04_170023 [Vibrio owensii]
MCGTFFYGCYEVSRIIIFVKVNNVIWLYSLEGDFFSAI